ncbi:MAG: hypothetical protein R6V56_09210 [Lentisphaeria bacterium]
MKFTVSVGVLAGVFLLPFWGEAQHVTIRKTASKENPPLFIADIKAPDTVRKKLRNTLRRCNWFNLVPAKSDARYVLQASYAGSGSSVLRMQVSSEGQVVFKYKEVAPRSTVDQVVYAAVDSLIERIFDNPGPCDSRIAFVLGQGDRKEIFTCNFDGSDIRQITRNGTISTEPAWGPNGENLAYTLYNRHRTAVVLADVKRGRQRRITCFRGLNSGASIAPGNNQIAICLSLENQVDLYIVAMDGEPEKRLTKNNAVESSPSWSPDGRRLVYVSDRAGRPRLYIRSLGGGKARRLLSEYAEQVSPDWSSVSGKICFSTRKDGRYLVAVTDPEDRSGKMRVITKEAGDWESPSWAPDGRHVICVHSLGSKRRLVMVDTRTGRAIPVLRKNSLSLPSWAAR